MAASHQIHNWKAPESATLPHFIIGGAMKSGTSTLHAMLDQHPDVFIPEEEIGFFDIDNILEHYDFNFFDRKSAQWTTQDMSKDPQLLWDWYSSKFKEGDRKFRGEDSTSYLASKFAARRISLQKPDIKMIFLLRHPSKRAFSNYHHLVRSGIISRSFEDVLQYDPSKVLNRSLYKDQLEQYYQYFPKENIKIVVFEDLIAAPKKVLKEVSQFLDLDFAQFQEEAFQTYSNPGTFPLFPRLHRLKNALNRRFGNSFYLKNLPAKAPQNVVRRAWLPKVLNRVHGMINPLKAKKSPQMKAGTRTFLDNYFKKELAGLDELIGKSILGKWFE